jgi:GR25 family glycosyltransferase involved in LPS biosynthesis
MAKSPKRSIAQSKILELANRRGGANYSDAAMAAQDRLRKLREDYERTPASYRGYLAVGICSCLESHIKYYYAAAAGRVR